MYIQLHTKSKDKLMWGTRLTASFLVVFLILFGSQVLKAQTLQKLTLKRIDEAPQAIEREKAVIYIRTIVPDIFPISTNPNYTFRKVAGKDGEYVMRINPNEAYVLGFGANGFLSTVQQRMVLKLREVQVWEVIAEKSDIVIDEGFGKLAITGSPEGATIELDYIKTAEKVPVTFDRVKSGLHTVRILSGNVYSDPETYQVTIQANKLTELKVEDRLVKATLIVDSYKVNSIKINGYELYKIGQMNPTNYPYEYVQKRTFYTVIVPAKEKVFVELDEPNYPLYKDSLEVAPGDTITVSPNRGKIILDQSLASTIWINGKLLKTGGSMVSGFPYKITNFESRLMIEVSSTTPITIKMDRPYHKSVEDSYTVDNGKQLVISKYPIPQNAYLYFETPVDSIAVLMADNNIAIKDKETLSYKSVGYSNSSLTIPSGDYVFKFEKNGYSTVFWEQIIQPSTDDRVRTYPIKIKKQGGFNFGKVLLWTAVLGGGGYAAYWYMNRDTSEPLKEFPLPPIIPTFR